MSKYILQRLLLMIPTLIGVLTITFIVTEYVPGGPADQIRAMLLGKTGDGSGEVVSSGEPSEVTERFDPKQEQRLRRRFNLHLSPLERYLRTLIWFSPDSIVSNQEIDSEETLKFKTRGRDYIVLRLGDNYHAFHNRWGEGEAAGELVYDQAEQAWRSVGDGALFEPDTGERIGEGEGDLEPLPLVQKPGAEEGRVEVYVKESWGQALANADNWHGFFLLRFGESIYHNKNVIEMIKERLPVSISLGLWSFLITYPTCLLLGIAKAVRNGTRFDAATSAVVLVGYSIPGFVLAVLLIVFFGPGEASLLNLFPLSGLTSAGVEGYEAWSWGQKLADYFHHLAAPIICLSIGSFAVLTMLTKNSVLEETEKLYVLAARARGLSRRKVLFKHILRNALIPLVTTFPSTFLFLFLTGSLLIEKIFSIDGLGLLGYRSVMDRDFPIIMGSLFIFTLIGLLGQLITDICYVLVDPRINFEGGWALMKLSPERRAQFRTFRQNRRAWSSLVILGSLFLLSLPAEVYMNDKPLVMRVDGRWYWPLVQSYSLQDFGGASPVPIENYRSPLLKRLLDGDDHGHVDPDWIYGPDDHDWTLDPDLSDEQVEAQWQERLEAEAQRERALEPREEKDSFWIWPLVDYNYKSKTYNPESGKENLVAPWAVQNDNPALSHRGAWRDGHWLGTDYQGKDVLARLVYGFRISLLFGLGLALMGTLVGCVLGALQGYFGGWIDLLGQRFTEVWSSMPRLYLLIILSSFLANTGKPLTDNQHYWLLFGILNLTAWMGMAAYMRAEFLKARNLDYVKAARALGVANRSIMFRHILPNALTPIITFAPFNITAGILALVSLDFLALGVRYPAPSLGQLLAQGQENLHAVWILLPTFLVLVVTLTLLTFIGDGVRDAFDPQVRKRPAPRVPAKAK